MQLEVASGMMFRTPYGAIIEWILPGENKMVAHLKDKTKVRQGKRWSQVWEKSNKTLFIPLLYIAT